MEGEKELPAASVIGGGRVSTDGRITEKIGPLTFIPSKPSGSVITVNHNYNNSNYVVMAMVDGTLEGNQDNIITLVGKGTNYFQIKGKNSTNATDEAAPFYFT